ncbi:hypothetical protein SMC26_13340 [Actinomadura fulvescens]|uniref:hypothetical protein n=1 Tax=Actinomadura fulvescens TaxID=46160 RepID=UPI0031E17F98
MICQACRERHHDDCRGGSWCACQHRQGPATPERRDRPETARSGPAGQAGEPAVNWKRQG